MITIINSKDIKNKINKCFKNDSFAVIIDINSKTIKFSGINAIITADLNVEGIGYKNVTLSYVLVNHAVMDILFNSNGFYYDTYKRAYNGVTIVNSNGTDCYISEVVFHSKNKYVPIMELCNPYFDMIKEG